MPDVYWNDPAKLEMLRALWAEGLSTQQIGRRMGASKNAIVGKAHRLHLPARPSPVKRRPEGAPRAPRKPRRVGKGSLPPLATLAAPPPVVAPPMLAPAAPDLKVFRAPPAKPYFYKKPCCWPIGEPGAPDFRFCEDAALPDRPYCGLHAARAYVKIRPKAA